MQRVHPNVHALQNITEQASPAPSERSVELESESGASAHLHASGGVISADETQNTAEMNENDGSESDTSEQAQQKADAEEERKTLEQQAVKIAEENQQWIDYDTHVSAIKVIVGSEIKTGELTIRTNPLKGFAIIKLQDDEDVLATFILGTKDFNVTVAEEKLALHVSDAGALDARHTGPTAVLLVAATHQEAKALASALCVGVFGNQPVIRGAKEAAARESAEKKKAEEEKLKAQGFMKPKVMYDNQGRPYVPKPVGRKGKSAKDSRYDGHGRFKHRGPGGGGDGDSVSVGGGGSISSASRASRLSHAPSQRGELQNAARPPNENSSRPVRPSPRPGSIISRVSGGSTEGGKGEVDSDSRYLLSDDDTYEPSQVKGPDGNNDDDMSDVSDDATYSSRAKKAARKTRGMSAEQRKQQQAKFREKDEAIMKQKQLEFQKKREAEAKSKEKEEYERDLYKLNRDMIVMRARARHTSNQQQVHEKLHACKKIEEGINSKGNVSDAKSETPSTSTGPANSKSSKSRATHSVVSSALSVISTISAKPTDVSDFNYNSHFNSLIPGNSPETQKRLDARRQVRAMRKQESEFVRRIEIIRTANENRAQKAEKGREYEMIKLLDKEAKMDEIMQREEAQFHEASKLLENRSAAKVAETTKKQAAQELNRQLSSMIHGGFGGRMRRDGSTFSHLGGIKSQASGLSIGMQHYLHGMHQQPHHKHTSHNPNLMENLYQGHGSRQYNKSDSESPERDTLVVGGAMDESIFEGAGAVQSTTGMHVHPAKKPEHRFHSKFKSHLKHIHLAQGGTNETFAKLHPRGVPKPHSMKVNKKTGAKMSDVQMGYFTFAATVLCSWVRMLQAQRRVQRLRREINAATIQYWFKSILARRKLLWLENQTKELEALELRRRHCAVFIGYSVFRFILKLRRKKKEILREKERRAAAVQEQLRAANLLRTENRTGGSRGGSGRSSPAPSFGEDVSVHSVVSAGSTGSTGKAEKKGEEKERTKMDKEDSTSREIENAAKREAKAKAKAEKAKKKSGGCCIL